jgi:hypothetical protein
MLRWNQATRTVRFMAGQAAFTTFAFVPFERAPDPHALETDCVAGHIGLEVRRETGKE